VSACILSIFSTYSFTANASVCPNPEAYPWNDCALEGLRPGSYPYFDQGVKNVIYHAKKNGDFSIKAQYDKKSNRSQFLLDLDNIFNVEKTKYKFKARYSDGELTGGVEIKGIIDGLGITKRETLMTAGLEGTPVLSLDGQLFGFNTTDIVCHEVFAMYCTPAESVYLVLDDAINSGKKNIKTSGVAVTTIPVPASVWLFGSGLLGLIGIGRRKIVA
jgi:hypothetical protein